MKYFFGLIAICVAITARGQHDTLSLSTSDDITNQTFQLEEIQVDADCDCIGICTCDSWQNPNRNTRFRSVEKILARSGQVALIRRGNYGFEPVLNGMTTERTNITIDGMKIFGACTDKMDPITSYVEVNNLERFTIENGSSGSEFGTSLGGSVNLETEGARIGVSDKWTGSMGLGFDAVANGLNTMFALNRSSEKWALNLKGTYRKSGNYKAGGGQEIAFSQYEKWNAALSGKYSISKHNLIRFDFIFDDANTIGYPGLPMDVEYAKARIYGLSFIHNSPSDFLTKLIFKAYANSVNHNMTDSYRPNVILPMDMPGETKTYGGYVKAEMHSGNHNFVAKIDGYYTNSFADMTMYPVDAETMYMVTWPDVFKTDFGIYLEDNYRWEDHNTISVKGRLEYLSNQAKSQIGIDQAAILNQDISLRDVRLTKALSVGYQREISNKLTAWFNVGYTERAPTVNEQYAFYIYDAYDGYNYVGNFDLNDESAVQGEVGANYQSENKYGIRATAFYYRMFDYILSAVAPDLSAMTPGANGVKITTNIPEAMMAGVRLNLYYTPVDKIDFRTQFSFLRGETGDGIPLPSISPLRNTTTVTYSFFKTGNLSFETESALAQDRINPNFGEVSSPGYVIFHLGGGYSFLISNTTLSVKVGIENLLDTKYHDHLDWGRIPRPGRNFYFNLRYRF